MSKSARGSAGSTADLRLAERLQHGQIVGGCTLGGQGSGKRLELNPQFAELLQVGDIHVRHVRPVARGDPHQVLVHEELERLLDREERDMKLCGEMLRVDQRAGSQLEGRNPAANQVVSMPGVHSLYFHAALL